jgi:hypothetical protein
VANADGSLRRPSIDKCRKLRLLALYVVAVSRNMRQISYDRGSESLLRLAVVSLRPLIRECVRELSDVNSSGANQNFLNHLRKVIQGFHQSDAHKM